ncbi:MAG: ABC transporter ATP-binding protein [Candidatus Omnitrophica bacterium]|nr:ABC transporter ATP-binding protein [Candidatus Omnitrophota bacterium]
MPDIRLKKINNFVCRDINLKIVEGEFFVLWGSTGAGKTTLLNIIAGFVEYEGSVLFNDVPVDGVPVSLRKMGYLFQHLALFPHLDVRSNVAYGLNIQKRPKKEVEAKTDELLDLMEISQLAHRYPKNLSGGEKQRVALARAVISSPKIMLLDEPLNSLDFDTAGRLRAKIQQFHRKSGVTTIYVTHCFEEAFALADRVAVLNDGKIVQIDRPENVLEKTECRMVTERVACECHKKDQFIGCNY